jgi:hypothetical protein
MDNSIGNYGIILMKGVDNSHVGHCAANFSRKKTFYGSVAWRRPEDKQASLCSDKVTRERR